MLAGTLYGSVTDEEGVFSLARVRPGRYTLRVSLAGFAGVERTLVVPSDVGGQLVISLMKARVDLNDEPLLFAAEALHADRSVPVRGDPYLADRSGRYSRVSVISLRRFGLAFSYPIVRGLTGGRTGVTDLLSPDSYLDIPGVGILDLAPIGSSVWPAVALVDPVVAPVTGDAIAGIVAGSPRRGGSQARENLVLGEMGYQSNSNTFDTRLAAVARGSKLHVTASGGYATGQDFESGDGQSWEGSFRHGGLYLSPVWTRSPRSRIALVGRLTRMGIADLPGSGAELGKAESTGFSARWTAIPEGKRVRRTDVSVGWTRSWAHLDVGEPPPAAIESWDEMRPDQSLLHAAAIFDLHVEPLDRLQSGLVVVDRRYDWDGDAISRVSVRAEPESVHMSNRRFRVSPYLAGQKKGRRFELAASTRLDVVRTSVSGETPLQEASAAWSVRPEVSAAVTLRARRPWELTLTAAMRHTDHPLSLVSPVRTPFRSGSLVASALGTGESGNDRLFFAGLRAARVTARSSISIRPFFTTIDDYLHPALVGPATYRFSPTDATIAGVEIDGHRQLAPFVSLTGYAAYHHGHNSALDEPLPSMLPFHGRLDLTASAIRGRILFELSSEFALSHNRLARSVDETGSDAYLIFHLWFAVPLGERLGLRTGIYNIFDADFAPHGHVFVQKRSERFAGLGQAFVVSLDVRS